MADETRTKKIEAEGYRVLRFWNHDVIRNLDGVLLEIQDALTPTPDPSPQGGGGVIVGSCRCRAKAARPRRSRRRERRFERHRRRCEAIR
ncbi:MAG: DUF559 domain-containing protein [Pseudomonadota bacterium]